MTFKDLLIILNKEKPSEELKERKEELFSLIPELKTCDGFDQNNPWHVYDVLEHTFHVVDGVSSNYIVRLAALFHDIGKPLSYYVGEDNLGHFHGHWVKSQEIFHKFAKKNNMDDKSRDLIEKLIFYHDLNVRKLNEEDFDKFIKEFNKDEIIMLFNLKKSDLLAHSPKYHYILEEYENTLDELLNNYF